MPPTAPRGTLVEVFLVALRLGLTSFGGPIAHIGYFRREYVERRRWVTEETYADLLALCQFLPGPASSQMGIAIGTLRAGYPGGVLAWLGFTLPSAVALLVFASIVSSVDLAGVGWLHGLKIAAVAVVAQAVWAMSRTLTPDRERITTAIVAAAIVLVVANPAVQVLVIIAGAGVGWWLYLDTAAPSATAHARGSRTVAIVCLVLFAALLVVLPLIAVATGTQSVAIVDVFYRVGSLVFGGGHVVLPLLEAEVVPPRWIGPEEFTAGYGAAQAVPGPLFTFAAYLGAAFDVEPNGVAGATLATGAVFLPSFLLVWGTLPFWNRLRGVGAFQAALKGIGAAVVGILGAALYDPVSVSAIFGPRDLALAAVLFGLLTAWRIPAWAVVILAAIGGEVIAL